MKKLILAGLLASAVAAPAAATTITYSLLDLLQTSNYSDGDTSQTFTGTGFVGEYNPNYGIGFAHLFGVETDGSRTVAQVGIAALAGKTISNATLSFVITNGGGAGNMVVTATDSNGSFGYQWNTPVGAYGQISTPIFGGSGATQFADFTSIVSNAVGAGEDWLGLHFQQNDGPYIWTYTNTDYGNGPDSAQVRLTVDYPDEVPEPAMLGLFGLGALGLGLSRRRKA